jgi:hypothetical protein
LQLIGAVAGESGLSLQPPQLPADNDTSQDGGKGKSKGKGKGKD